MGCPTDPIGASPTGLRGRRFHGGSVSGEASPQATLADLASFPEEPPPHHRSCDFFVVPTVTFRLLYCFVVLAHVRRHILHLNVTFHPSAEWTLQQIVEAFPADGGEPRYLLRDRDSIYGDEFRRRVQRMGIEQVLTARRSPWQNPYAERVIGSIRRECTDRVIVFGEEHLRRILFSYQIYYNEARTHLSLDRNSPVPRAMEPPSTGKVVALPQVGGLHHRYTRAA